MLIAATLVFSKGQLLNWLSRLQRGSAAAVLAFERLDLDVEFFHPQDFVAGDTVRFFVPFDDFRPPDVPRTSTHHTGRQGTHSAQ